MTEIVNSKPEFYDDAADMNRLNTLFDAITAKRFASPVIFAQAVRGACDLHGITLPLLDIEGGNGATVEDGKFVLARVSSPQNPNMYAAPTECEHAFHIEDADGNVSDIYLYIVVDCDEEGLYECYAQLVDEDELQDVLNMDEAHERTFPEVEKETSFEIIKRQTRGEPVVDDTPPEM